MKIKVYVKYHDQSINKIESYGTWIDLRSAKNYEIKKDTNQLIDLNVSMKLPKYYQANIVPRSSTHKNFGLIQLNHYGVVDGPDSATNGYSGNNDKWYFNGYALGYDSIVKANDRICQFEIKPSMFAPWYVKFKWLFSNKLQFVEVDDLDSEDRGGFGTTGI